MKLVIAEKPSVGAAIAAVMGANEKRSGYFEGGGYLVSWCIGHLISLADAATYNEQFRKWKYDDLPIVPQEWQFIVASGKEQQFSILKDLMHRSDVTEIINACDSGREGELIFRFVYEQANCKKPFSRLWISSMEASAIREGFSNLKDGRGYDNLYQSALCRAKADWLIGINATRLFSILYHKTLNVGRVQTPTLAMLVNRDYAISSFKKEKYHVVRLDVGGVAALSERQDDEAAARQMKAACEKSQAVTFSIYQLKRGDETRDLRFEPYDRLQAAGLTIDRVNYELVYTAPLTKDMTLGDIWERFNIDHPADFKGHSLSVSDIVVLHQNDEDTAHYVDSIGFQQVPEFLQEQQTPVFDKLPPEQQQALSDTVQDTLQMLVDADKRIYGDVTGKTLEAIAAQGYSYKDGQLEKQQPEATPDSLLTGETVRTPRGNFHITDMSREQIEAAGFGFHHASEDGKYLIMGNGTQAYAIAAEQPQRDNPLKHVEDTIEQNDNNFDGLINNTPQTPTVADFEQRAKAGEAISVTDLAKAVKAEKREQPQKKPSILKKLDEYKKQAAQQPKDKQKEHKKDLEV